MPLKERLDRYRATALPSIEGWVHPDAVDALEVCARYQSERGVSGDALEIGVHKGRFFLALMACLEEGEAGVAADIFAAQELNVDHSGAGVEAAFRENLAAYAENAGQVVVLSADSLVTRPADLLRHSPANGFRLASIDGGHTAEHVMNDMDLVSQCIVNGAVVLVDDWMSPHWPGVHEGFLRYMMTRNRNLAPVLFTGNKLLMTTISHQEAMIAWMQDHYIPDPRLLMREVRICGFRSIAAA